MKQIVTFLFLFSILALVYSAPQSRPSALQNPKTTTTFSPNPNVNLIRLGLIDKLCKQRYPNLARTTPRSASNPTAKPRNTRQIRTTEKYLGTLNRSSTTSPPSPSGPTCGDFNGASFEDLINMVKKTLKPVPQRT